MPPGRSTAAGLRAELVAEERQHVVRLRIPAEHRLREDELTVDVYVEDPVRPRHDLDGTDRLLPLLEDPRRQTGGVRKRSSGDAVLDAYVVTLRHCSILPPRSPGCRAKDMELG
jgi:hypothetical protein